MIESVSPNTGLPFARWTPAEDSAVNRTLERLGRGTERLTADLDLRRDVLDRALAALAQVGPDLSDLNLQEVGKTRPEAEGEIPYAASFLQVARDLVDTHPFRHSTRGRTIDEVPRGIGLLIAPYNDPVAGLTRKIGPCLAAGAAALVKPSELGVHCAMRLGQAFSDAGLDDFISVTPLGAPDRVSKLIAAPDIGTISFTGSTEVGLNVAAQASGAAKGFIGELGGTNPLVLLADADLDRAIPDLITRKIKAAGQACSAQNIVYAAADIVDEVAERIAAALAAVTFGPADLDVQMGPVRTAAALDRLAATCAGLEGEGGQRICGKISPATSGTAYLAPPTAYRVPEPGCLADVELFGPLMGLCAFEDLASLRRRLARNRQPLVLYVYGQDPDQIAALTAGLRYGSIGVNTTAIQGPDVPTGGFGAAGIGREGGVWGLQAFLTTINRREAT